jgi:hypothetical protein
MLLFNFWQVGRQASNWFGQAHMPGAVLVVTMFMATAMMRIKYFPLHAIPADPNGPEGEEELPQGKKS